MTPAGDTAVGGALRIDKLLWYLRFARSRAAAQALVGSGHVRMDGRRIERASAMVRAGALVVLPHGSGAVAIRIITLPQRRGPAAEAASCYAIAGDAG